MMYIPVSINFDYLCFLLKGKYRDMFWCYFEIFVNVTWQHTTKFLVKEKRENTRLFDIFLFQVPRKALVGTLIFNTNPKFIWNVTGFRKNAKKKFKTN